MSKINSTNLKSRPIFPPHISSNLRLHHRAINYPNWDRRNAKL